MKVLWEIGGCRVRIEAVGCEDCGAPTAEGGRPVLLVVAGLHAMVALPRCQACEDRRNRGEFAGLTPWASDRPLPRGF